MIELVPIQDWVLMSSAFYWAVIHYAKPFLNSKFEGRNIRYPIKHIKNVDGFSDTMHSHLIEVRNTLVAHDDFTEIPPRILQGGINLGNENGGHFVPTSIMVSNKCIAFPSSPETVNQMHDHSSAVLKAIQKKLSDDIATLRKLTIESREAAVSAATYQKGYGQANLEDGRSVLNPPDFGSDPWLKSPVPDFSELHNGYEYEEKRVNEKFHGPEKIELPNGEYYKIIPS